MISTTRGASLPPSSSTRMPLILSPSTATAPRAFAASHKAHTAGVARRTPASAWYTASSAAAASSWYCGKRAVASAAERRS